MSNSARFDLKMNSDEKELVSRAAAIMGTTMAAFVRSAVKEKARQLLELETRLTLTQDDFVQFTAALDNAFEPNTAMKKALDAANGIKRA